MMMDDRRTKYRESAVHFGYKASFPKAPPQDVQGQNVFSSKPDYSHARIHIACADPKTVNLGQSERKRTSASVHSIHRDCYDDSGASRDSSIETDGPLLQLSLAVELLRKNVRNEAYTSSVSGRYIDDEEMLRSLLQNTHVNASPTMARRIGSLAYTNVSPETTQKNEAAAKRMMARLARSQAQGRSGIRARTPPRRSYDHDHTPGLKAGEVDELKKVEWRVPSSHERPPSNPKTWTPSHGRRTITDEKRAFTDERWIPSDERQTPAREGGAKFMHSRWRSSPGSSAVTHEIDDDDSEFKSEKAGFVNTSRKSNSKRQGGRRFREILNEQRERSGSMRKCVPSRCTCQ